jgi:hypothetical protein
VCNPCANEKRGNVGGKGENNICFVIGPIGAAKSFTRYRSDQVLEFLIQSVVEPMRYEVVRANKQATPGIITNQIINQVIDAGLVIADLTDHNGNAFYELAVRHV